MNKFAALSVVAFWAIVAVLVALFHEDTMAVLLFFFSFLAVTVGIYFLVDMNTSK